MSKYIDADLLKKEIERLGESNTADLNNGCDDDQCYGYYLALSDFERLIDSLQQEQPSLPSNLDEAAREIVIKMYLCLKDCAILGDRLTRGQLMDLVKAGAEWMANRRRNK